MYVKTNHDIMSAKRFLSFSANIAKVPPGLMDLRRKYGVDCSLPTRDIAIFICAILHPKTTIFTRELKGFRIRGPLHIRVYRVAFSRGRRVFKLSTCR